LPDNKAAHTRHDLQDQLKTHFGNEIHFDLLDKPAKPPRNTWYNITITFFGFIVFLYCCAIQIWLIVRAFRHPSDLSSPEMSASAVSLASSKVASVSDYFAISDTPALTARTTTVVFRSSKPTATSSTKFEQSGRVTLIESSKLPEAARPSLSDELYFRRRRGLRQTAPSSNMTASCLYYEGSQVAKHGEFAVALNVLHNFWIIVFVLLLLSYERKRLRFSRKAHSAAVVGFIQSWL
jgi:hypothetical protein